MLEPNNNQSPTRNQKIAVAVLVFFAFLVIVLWFIQFKKSLNVVDAYRRNSSAAGAAKTGTGIVDDEKANEEAQKTKDTDGDGLSDWDELNAHNTSPYLADSDSDGENDGAEVAAKTDPNCPKGKDCSGAGQSADEKILENQEAISQSDQASVFNNIVGQIGASGTPATAPANPAAGANTLDLEKYANGQLDAAALRAMLLAAGMDKDMLNKIPDDALLKSYQETLKK